MTGQTYKGTSVDAMSISPDTVITQFQDVVHVKNPNKITGISTSNLVVYKNKAVRNNAQDEVKEQPLKSSWILDGLGRTEEDALIVVVPTP